MGMRINPGFAGAQAPGFIRAFPARRGTSSRLQANGANGRRAWPLPTGVSLNGKPVNMHRPPLHRSIRSSLLNGSACHRKANRDVLSVRVNGLATTTSHSACATGNSAKWRVAEDFSRQVMARL